MREEVATVISNRSAAYLEEGDVIAALVDAETVISLKRPWSKGHFRKTRALIQMGRLEEAKETVQLGLSFEPVNTVRRVLPSSYELSSDVVFVLYRK